MLENTKLEKPNLFDFATKELSQDAMICWLIRWADDRLADTDRELHACGREFVQALLREHGIESLLGRVETTTIQQDKSIDVLARVGPDYVLLIEDKTGTKDHGGQLKRYYEAVTKGHTKLGSVNPENVFPIYLKTGNQSRAKDRRIEGATEGYHRPYRVFNRTEFLAVLNTYGGDHHALLDYRDYLSRKENKTRDFRCWQEDKRNEWSWESWDGFYQYLEDTLNAGDWGYVANPSGGFLGFWWNFIRVNGNGGPRIYLQLEADIRNKRYLLCFRVSHVPKAQRQELIRHWHKRIIKAGGNKVRKPARMRAGGSSAVAHWNGEWLAFGKEGIDLVATVENLKFAGRILREAAG